MATETGMNIPTASTSQVGEILDQRTQLGVKHRRASSMTLERNPKGDTRTQIMEELIKDKMTAQLSRSKDLLARLRVIELCYLQEDMERQFKYLDCKMDQTIDENRDKNDRLTKRLNRKDFENSVIDTIEEELQNDSGDEFADHILKNKEAFRYARYSFHKRDRKALRETSYVMSEIIKDVLPDETETESSSDDETPEAEMLYKSTAKDKTRCYRPISTLPIANWADFRLKAISSWAWVEHAIEDTEFRRKKNEALHNHMRRSKPTFQLESPPVPNASACPSIKVNDIEGVKVFTTPGAPSPFDLRYESHEEVEEKTLSNLRAKQPNVKVSENFLCDPVLSESLRLLANVSATRKSLTVENKPETEVKSKQKTPDEAFISDRTGRSERESLRILLKDGDNDETMVAARCRPLKLCKPRKIFNMDGIGHFMTDVFDPIHLSDCLCNVGEACVLCLGAKYKVRHGSGGFRSLNMETSESKSLSGRMANCDSTYHHALSTVDEIPIGLLLNNAIKCATDSDHNEEIAISLPFISTGPDEEPQVHGRLERDTPTSLPAEITKRGRGRPPTGRQRDRSPELSEVPGRLGRGSSAMPRKKRQYKRRTPYARVPGARKRKNTDKDSDYDYSPSKSNSSSSAFKKLSNRRTRDFDISNIVVPRSAIPTTIGKKLKVVPIECPTFRIKDYTPLFLTDAPSAENKKGIKRGKRFVRKMNFTKPKDSYESSEEDLDDDIIRARHDRCEAEEKRKYNTFFTHVRRKRLKSQTENSVAGVKPADNVEVHEVSPPNTPHTSDNFINDESHLQVISSEEASLAASALKFEKGKGRSRRPKEDEEVEECPYTPFSPRHFPISDEDYALMLQEAVEEEVEKVEVLDLPDVSKPKSI